MTIPSRKTTALVRAELDGLDHGTMGTAELRDLFEHRKVDWGFSRFTGFGEFLEFATAKLPLSAHQLQFPDRTYQYYAWGAPDPLEIWRALGTEAYLSHYSALQLHDLTDDRPRVIYISVLGRPRRPPRPLTQAQIFASMPRPDRQTSARCPFGEYELVRLNQHLPDVAVKDAIAKFDQAPRHQLATVENTLLQAAMRPDYCGGLANVVEAYRRAKDVVSTNRLRTLIRAAGYAYPYAQSVGFLMARTGYGERSLALMRSLVTDLSFFLVRGERTSMGFDPTWNLYYPPLIDDLTNARPE